MKSFIKPVQGSVVKRAFRFPLSHEEIYKQKKTHFDAKISIGNHISSDLICFLNDIRSSYITLVQCIETRNNYRFYTENDVKWSNVLFIKVILLSH